MTAESNAATVVCEVINVNTDDIKSSPVNPRNFACKEHEIEELAQNIKSQTQLQPILIRPVKGKKPYELVFGERRLRACKLIGLSVQAIVRKLDNFEAHNFTVIENLQREDLTPFEESNGIQTLLDSGQEVQVIADKLGKPVSWVRKRAKLRDLSLKWRKAIAYPKHHYSLWSVTHLELIARFEKEIQDEIYNRYDHYFNCPSIKELKKDLNCYLLKLGSAPWKIDDKNIFPKAGACSKCLKRSSVVPDLFEEVKNDDKNDRCLDKNCWVQKLEKYLELKEKELRKQHSNLILLDCAYHDNKLLSDDSQLKEKADYSFNFEDVKKSDPEAVPALVIDGPGTGQLRWVKHRYNSSFSSESNNFDEDGNKLPTPLSGRRKKLQKKTR